MTKNGPKAAPNLPPPKDPREERLAEALRSNLNRRKAQARARAVGAAEPQPGPPAEPVEPKE